MKNWSVWLKEGYSISREKKREKRTKIALVRTEQWSKFMKFSGDSNPKKGWREKKEDENNLKEKVIEVKDNIILQNEWET